MSGTSQRTSSNAPAPTTGTADTVPALTVVVHPVDPGTEVVEVGGDIDMSTAPTLLEHILERVHGGARYLIVDLTAVGFLSAAGLSALVTARAEGSAAGSGGLCVVARHHAVVAPLVATGLDVVLDLRPDLSHAYALAIGVADRGRHGLPDHIADGPHRSPRAADAP
ncbi:STAS domain-containing protein [Saccharothrix xinjiangensis]|uniref:STAS domain-containing protein n=1 Tax=Saccharothrix xinjiangensis TaxID=204798 RepID=A0ABV9XZA1_9PSEU